MSEEKEFRFKCKRCGSCCTDKNTIVNVTYNDILRIKEALGLNLDEINFILSFYIFEKEPTEEDKKKMVVSPVETERGKAFVGLKKTPDGSCYFYDKNQKKCRIYKARPNFCRTFPFSFRIYDKTAKKLEKMIEIKYTEKAKQYCQGIGEEAPIINKKKWLKLGKVTLEDLNKNYYIIQKWNKAVQNKEMEPNVSNFLRIILNIEEKREKN